MSAAIGSGAPRAAAIGGGTGLPRVLSTLVDLGYHTTAVVTVADDGGSSGRLRREIGVLPPGDVRNCLVALAEPGNLLAEVFQYRFPAGEGLAGHALGNLVLTALADITGGFAEGVRAASELLDARGTVLPSTLADVHLAAEDAAGALVVGQATVANSPGPIRRVLLEPPSPPGYGPALDAVLAADLVVIGPGSLFTSLLPNFLVSCFPEALRDTAAARVYVCNVANQRGETSGMDACDHVAALLDHGLAGALDTVVVHDTDARPLPAEAQPVDASAAVRARIEALGVQVIAADLADPADPRHHDPARLAAILREV